MCPDTKGLGHENCCLVRLRNYGHVVEKCSKFVGQHMKPDDFILVRLIRLCDA